MKTRGRFELGVLSLLALLIATAFILPLSFGEQPEQDLYLKLVVPRVAVDIPDAGLTFDVGSRVRFFQQTGAHFIGLTETMGGDKRLFAVPNRSGNRKNAWVTPEKLMFFGFRTRTCKGIIILIAPEKLPVLEVSNAGYLVQIERYGEKALLHVPKNVAGVELVSEMRTPPPTEKEPPPPLPEPKPVQVQQQAMPAKAKASKIAVPVPVPAPQAPDKVTGQRPQLKVMLDVEETPRTVPAPPEKTIPQPAAEEPAVVHLALDSEIEEVPPVVIPDLLEEVVAEVSLSVEEDVLVEYEDIAGESAGEDTGFTETPVPDVKVEPAAPAKERTSGPSWVAIVVVVQFILILFLAVLVFRRRSHEKAGQNNEAQPSAPAASAADPIATMTSKGFQDEVSLCGAVESMSLFAVVEILLAKREDGLLSVSTTTGQEAIGSMTVHDGQVIDSCFGAQRGPDAFNGLMRLKTGVFMFVRCDTDQYERTIDEPTVSLLMKTTLPS